MRRYNPAEIEPKWQAVWEEQKANETIRQYLYLTEIREMEVEKLIVRCQYDEAIRLLDEGIEIAKEEIYPGTDSKWLKLNPKEGAL
jgi:hypothetical protein